jgi:hypothetical protein
MKRLIAASLFLALALIGSIAPAAAAQVLLCPSSRAQANSSAGQISLPNLSQAYAADPAGCVLANGLGDIAILRAAGYSEQGKHRSIIFSTGVATGTTNFVIGNLPAGAYIQKVIWSNISGNAAGNVALGSTASGVDIVASVACAANCLTDNTIIKTTFSTTAATPLNLSSSAWGSANLNVTVIFGYF